MPVAKSRSFISASKGQKFEQQKKAHVFNTYNDIYTALQAQEQTILIENLIALRNHLSILPREDRINPQDHRLLLAQQWLAKDPGARDIFQIWDKNVHTSNPVIAQLLVATLSSLLTLLSSHYTFHALGLPIVKTILAPNHLRRLNSYLGGTHHELILVTLKLYNALSNYAGGREKKVVLESFGWEIKSLPKLLNMRRKSSNRHLSSSAALDKPDIRTLYMLFILSFVDSNSSSQVKTMFIEQHQSAFLSIFKGLIQDSYHVIRLLLESCWTGIWSDPKVKRTLKIGLFNETTISHLVKLYARDISEDGNDNDPENTPANLVHHFLLAICTRPGTGICFKDRGWYARESDPEIDVANTGAGEEVQHPRRSVRGGVYNKILANVLKSLRVNEDPREQELALKILSACPELVSGYWSGASLTLEPRLSSKWITNVAFFGSIISLPVPVSSFQLPNSNLHHPFPPPLANIIENIIPSTNTKINFTRGLQSLSNLVRHCTAIALVKCLMKYEKVISAFKDVSDALGENETDGLWLKRIGDIEREARKRVPDFQVIIAFSHQHKATEGFPDLAPTLTESQQVREGLLSEVAERLLWMYHRSLPLLVTQARFDVGKVLQNFVLGRSEHKLDGSTERIISHSSHAQGLDALCQLHILRLLKDSDQFVWTGSLKMGSSSQSYLTVLLYAYASAGNHSALRVVLSDLLEHLLSESILFQEDASEPRLWLISLPTLQRAPDTESPDGAPLTDEIQGVISFFDDCVQRCLKTPYRYIEDKHSLANVTDHTNADHLSFDILPSPLLMTVLEQLEIKVSKRLLSPSDVLAMATFVYKLGFRLSSKQQDLTFLRAVAAKFDHMLRVSLLFPEFPVISAAIRREVGLLNGCLSLSLALSSTPHHLSEQIANFLSDVEQMPIPESEADRKASASELVDWLRLVDDVLGSEELERLSSVIIKLHPPFLYFIVEHAAPRDGLLWEALGRTFPAGQMQSMPFDFLFLHASEAQITNKSCRAILAEQALRGEPTLTEANRAVCLISHRYQNCSDNQRRGLLSLLTSVLKRSATAFRLNDFRVLKEIVFSRSSFIKSGLIADYLPDDVREGFYDLVVGVLDPLEETDRVLIAGIRNHWLEMLNSGLANISTKNSLVCLWLRYFHLADLFDILDNISLEMGASPSPAILNDVLLAMKSQMKSGTKVNMTRRLPRLIALRPHLADLSILEELIAVILKSCAPTFYTGYPRAETFSGAKLHDITEQSELRWSRRSHRPAGMLQMSIFLTEERWSPSTATIFSSLIYKGYLSRSEFFSWLTTEHCSSRTPQSYVTVMHAFLDRSCCLGQTLPDDHGDWASQLSRLFNVTQDDELPQDTRALGATCLALIVELTPTRVSDFVSTIVRSVQALTRIELDPYLLSIGRQIRLASIKDATPLVEALVEHGLQSVVRLFAEETYTSSHDATIDVLAYLVNGLSAIKLHLAETVIGVVIQAHLACLPAVRLVAALLSNVHLKPAAVNRYLQSILQHTDFYKHCANSPSGTSPTRNAVVNLLHVAFHLHPANTSQVTHVEPLVRIYSGTLSQSDIQILSIFQMFEIERKVSIAALLNRWSPSVDGFSTGSLETLQNLDSVLVLHTCLHFPGWRQLQEMSTKQTASAEARLYDPVFLLLLFSQMLSENPPNSAFAWVQLFRTNIVGLLIRALSSKDGAIRDVALCQIVALWKCVEAADLQERPHILYILGLLKNALPSPTSDIPRRLPSYTTLLLCHALRGVFYPSNFTYPITARFLLQRPELDLSDVPMLYSMLYGSSSEWKKERGWMIRFLSDGMMSTGDWQILKGRHTWDLLASLFQSSEDDRALRAGILEVLASLTCNTQAMASLVLKSGLLSWIEIQLLTLKTTEILEWTKILSNIMTIADPKKFESSTNGEWLAIICRCLLILLDKLKHASTADNFPLIARAALRLSLLSESPLPDLLHLLKVSVVCLRSFEASINVPITVSCPPLAPKQPHCHPPGQLYKAREIHEPFNSVDDPLQLWGLTVETLWRISMKLEEASDSWNALTCRMIVWNALCGGDTGLPAWVRRQAICNMGSISND